MSELNEMIQASKESYINYAAKLPAGCQQIANHLREDSVLKAIDMIRQFSEGVAWLNEMNTILQKNNAIIPLEVSKIFEYLEEVNDGLSIQDYVIVADMFEYELQPFFEEHLSAISVA
ncbi:hypothetical protein [Psychrobacillus sp. NPDC096623]|uniref:hypothetical protein n=1 Tax=Psychrobacillus sp. NPDC096623 TaxID=3364492 RepID=UPI0037FFC41C